MKKLILLFTLLTFVGCKEDKEVILGHEYNVSFIDGVAFRKYDMSLLNATVIVKYDNGQLMNETSYKNGQKISRKEWFENGNLSYEGNFKNGKQDGVQKSWHMNGQLWKKKKYSNGKLISSKEWYKNGSRKK